MNVIDLDRPAVVAVPRRRAPHVFVLVALVVGVMLGGAVTYGWNVRRQSAARDRVVSVFVFAQASPFIDGGSGGSVVVDGRVASVTLTRRVTVVNAGPVAVDIRGLSAVRPGVIVRGVEKSRWVAAGGTAQADADVQVDCARGLPLGRIPVTISVRTVDERSRQARPRQVLDGTPWSEQAEVACAGNG